MSNDPAKLAEGRGFRQDVQLKTLNRRLRTVYSGRFSRRPQAVHEQLEG
jgi:hypothetical protein